MARRGELPRIPSETGGFGGDSSSPGTVSRFSPAGIDYTNCDKAYRDEVEALEAWIEEQEITPDILKIYSERWDEIRDDYERCTNDAVHGKYQSNNELGLEF